MKCSEGNNTKTDTDYNVLYSMSRMDTTVQYIDVFLFYFLTALDEPYTSPVMSVLSLPIGLAITLIIAIAIGVSAFILLLGLIMLRR